MSKNELLKYIAAIVTTVAETEIAPESSVYMALGMDMEKYQIVRNVMVGAKLITVSGNAIRLTDAGKEMADKVNALVKV